MKDVFDIRKFNSYEEDNRKEVKKASGGLPESLWETYSAFANGNGGVIILGVVENADHSWQTTGLKDASKLQKQFWDIIHNPNKVSVNILKDGDLEVYHVKNDVILVIYVPRANREDKPVYINGDIFKGTFRRDWEGDYKCTKEQVKAMLRDQTAETYDMALVKQFTIDDFDEDTVNGYKNLHSSVNPEHPFLRLERDAYLRSIGAAGISPDDKKLYPTVGGMLMFGKEYDIVRIFPNYFLDYREMIDPTIRWTDRLQSSSGEWSGNALDFFHRVNSKITKDLKIPFKMEGIYRVDDTPMHKALREALANCLVNTDFYGVRGVVIKKEQDKLILENPGYIRTGKEQMRLGGVSDPRNQAMMKMFNLVKIGERSGSGIPDVFNAWADEGLEEPIIEEQFKPDRTVLTLSFKKKNSKKSAAKIGGKKSAAKIGGKKSTKTEDRLNEILQYMQLGVEYKTNEVAEMIGLQSSRTRELLNMLVEEGKVEILGEDKNRKYMHI